MKQEKAAPVNAYINVSGQPVMVEFAVCTCRSVITNKGTKAKETPLPNSPEMYSPIYVYFKNGGYMVEKGA